MIVKGDGPVSRADFDAFFAAATDHRRFDYQRRLAGLDTAESTRCSMLISVPTGLGKTAAVVLAWLWNRVVLPHQGIPIRYYPRRLVYCLPMRTLVEQTRKEVERWLKTLLAKAEEIGLCANSKQDLQWLVDHSPVVLMGGEDNEPKKADWDIWPEKPCILIGTQDMLLSRALNRGYAMSRYRWPMHFGLLNSDCLWVMDEVQLMGPGLWTSGQLDWMRQERFGSTLPCWTWWMSATNSDGFLDTPDRGALRPSRFPFNESEMPPQLREAQRPCNFWTPAATGSPKKGRSSKTPRTAVGPEDEFSSALALAVVENHEPGTLSLVVCNTVRMAQKLHERLRSLGGESTSLILLTSRFRKRDRQAHENTLIEFEERRKKGTTAGSSGLICIATQVVEAGVDVSACRLWTEVAPWPSIVQRLGRLNRDGLANGNARAFFFEVPRAEKGKLGKRIGPYTAEAVTTGERLAQALVEVYREHPDLSAFAAFAKLTSDEQIKGKMTAALQPAKEPFPRALDVHGLFSTEPDLFGGFTDVGQFIRGEDPHSDVTVFWREFDPAKPPARGDTLSGPSYDPEEGCAVPIHRFREFIRDKGVGFVWDDRANSWQNRRADDLYPGMVVLLAGSAGGYDVLQGWTGQHQHRLAVTPPPGPFEEEFRADPFSELGEWVSLADHLSDVRREADRIVTDIQLPDPIRTAVVRAAEHHDIGKALEEWQSALPHPAPNGEPKWAKAPFLFAVRPSKVELGMATIETALSAAGIDFRRGAARPGSRLADCYLWHISKRICDTAERKWLSEIRERADVHAAWMVPFRPGLRHEAASALALWHKYFHEDADLSGLTIYLVAAHHGKVRAVLTARTREGNDVCGVPRHSTLLPWNGGLQLDFSCATDGANGEFVDEGTTFACKSPGWTALVADLLGGWQQRPAQPALLALRNVSEPAHLGPFALAYLETLIRCADVQASQNPSRFYNV